jgi:hypothetical protein
LLVEPLPIFESFLSLSLFAVPRFFSSTLESSSLLRFP